MKIVVWIYIHLCVCQKHFYALWVVTYNQPKYILNYSDNYVILVIQAQLKWGTSEFPNLSIYWIASTIVIGKAFLIFSNFWSNNTAPQNIFLLCSKYITSNTDLSTKSESLEIHGWIQPQNLAIQFLIPIRKLFVKPCMLLF